MAFDLLYTAETGIADGIAVTLANSDDGTAGFAWTPTTANGGTIQHSTDTPLYGSRSIRFDGSSQNTAVARVDYDLPETTTSIVLDVAYRTPSYPTAQTRLLEVMQVSGFAVRVTVDDIGKLRLFNSDGASVFISTSSVNTATDGWRMGIRVVQGTTTTGRLEFSYYSSKNAMTPTESMTTLTNTNAGTSPMNLFRLGKVSSSSTMAPLWSDNWQISNNRTTLFGQPPAGDTVSAGTNQVNLGPRQAFTLTATSSSGSVVWSQVSGETVSLSGAGALTRTGLAPVRFTAGSCIFRATNGTVTDDVTISYLPTPVAIKRGGVISPTTIFIKTP